MINIFENKWLMGFLWVGGTVAVCCVIYIIFETIRIYRNRSDLPKQSIRNLRIS